MHVFVDTNILLNFFHFSSEELDALANVFASQEKGAASIHLTDQVVAEFRRNREAKIIDALKRFKDFRRGLQLPHFMRAYSEFSKAHEVAGELQANLSALEKKAEADIAKNKLHADELILSVISSASILPTTEAIYGRARMRVDLGNPPGKEGSLGDAVNWELLLETVPNGEDLHVVTEDKDFYSSIDTERANPFLEAEWHDRKSSDVHLYRTLSKFLDQHFDGITPFIRC
jgi:predicted nucleic acid-binding protein